MRKSGAVLEYVLASLFPLLLYIYEVICYICGEQYIYIYICKLTLIYDHVLKTTSMPTSNLSNSTRDSCSPFILILL